MLLTIHILRLDGKARLSFVKATIIMSNKIDGKKKKYIYKKQ